MTRLWEVDHPFYGPDDNASPCESFAELRAVVDALGEGMNHVYRFDWYDAAQPAHDDNYFDGEDRSRQELTVYLVLPRRSMFSNFTCPVKHEEEPEVLEWLRSDRVLGALRRLWAPILDGQEVGS